MTLESPDGIAGQSFTAPAGSATPDAEYDVICGDECVASASGPTEDAWREAMCYAQQYRADGEIEIWEVTRRKVWPNDQALTEVPSVGNAEAQPSSAPSSGSVTPDTLIVAFVQGAQWWEYHNTGATMWASDRDQAEGEAETRAANGTLGKSPNVPDQLSGDSNQKPK